MIRLALPKGRNQEPVLAALRSAGLGLSALDSGERRLLLPCPEDGFELLLLKGWDVPRYVEHGIADCGVVGSDVLEEVDGDLLVPVRFRAGRSRLSLIGRAGALPAPGSQVRLATKYPQTARRILEDRSWGAEILELSGSIELAPLLDLADVALDIVQTGQTLAENQLVELETVREVADCLVVNRASFQQHRQAINDLIGRLEAAEVAT
ncbi:MAG: ATP phosphoribosyltransferase [Acidobacteria bacterium]|nr:ATP phosphoribosyltransferase [Acidobacteriota bacterium]